MSDDILLSSLGERVDQSVYILSFKPKLIKVGLGVRPIIRRGQVARNWGMKCRLSWSTEPHPRAPQVERAAHRALKQFRVGMRELFACTVDQAKAAIQDAALVEDEWIRTNPDWLAEHVARRLQAEANYTKFLEARRQWLDPTILTEDVVRFSGMSRNALYKRYGPRGTPRFGKPESDNEQS